MNNKVVGGPDMPFGEYGVWTCDGEVVRCHDEASTLCASPDMSVASCLLGGGDCDGY